MVSRLATADVEPFIITVSSRALFDLEESHRIFEEQGMEAFTQYQREMEQVPLEPGPAFSLVKKLMAINDRLPEEATPFEVVLLSRNSPETGVRIFNTIEQMGLDIQRAFFTSGGSTSSYIEAIGTQLFLSSNPKEVAKAIKAGIGAATIIPFKNRSAQRAEVHPTQIRIAFDGDAVLFGDESERVHNEGGLAAFQSFEKANANNPMGNGPFRPFLEAIHAVQQVFPHDDCPIRTALVTARGVPAQRRAIMTLRDWDVRVDEAMFLGGRNKGPFLRAFGADIFFDDSTRNIEHALDHVASAHVPYGVRNEALADESRFSGGQAKPRPAPPAMAVAAVDGAVPHAPTAEEAVTHPPRRLKM